MTSPEHSDLPPELDPAQGDVVLEPHKAPGEQPGKRHSQERNDPAIQPGASDPPET